MPGPAAIECFTFENICRPAPCTGSRVSRPAPAALQPRPLLAAAPDVSEYIRRGGFFSLRQESSHQKFPCGLRPPPSGGNALLQNHADGSVRDVFLCSGMGGNARCRKGSMYPRPARLRLRAAKPSEGSVPRTFSSAPRPPPCRIAMRRGVVAPYAADAACLRRSRLFSTLFYYRAEGKEFLTRRQSR